MSTLFISQQEHLEIVFSLINNVNPQAGTQAYTAIKVQHQGIKKLLQIMNAQVSFVTLLICL